MQLEDDILDSFSPWDVNASRMRSRKLIWLLARASGHGSLIQLLGCHARMHRFVTHEACSQSRARISARCFRMCSWRWDWRVVQFRSKSIIPSAASHLQCSTSSISAMPRANASRTSKKPTASSRRRAKNDHEECVDVCLSAHRQLQDNPSDKGALQQLGAQAGPVPR